MSNAEAFMIVGTTVALFGTIAFVAGQLMQTWRANLASRAVLARDREYQTLADKATYTQQKLLEQQERLLTEVGEMRQRVVHIEQKLAEVD
jgi:hypothetical protein